MALILVDGDDTSWDLVGEWIINRYNRDYKDNITKEQITDWDITKFLKPECGSKIYEYLDAPDLYDELRLFDGVIWAIQKLRSLGHRCIFVSSGIHPGKRKLLYKHGLINTDKDLIIARDKSVIRADIMVDDGYHNICDFKGTGILFDAAHNRKYSHPYRAMNWYDVVKIVCAVEAWDHREREEYATD